MQKEIKLLKVFTTNPEQGNPAAVVLDAHDLTDQDMQKIAKHYCFSESAFIQRSTNGADFRVRFFSPNQEVSLCIHALMAAIKVKYDQFFKDREDITFRVETLDQTITVSICADTVSIQMPEYKFSEVKINEKEVADILNIREEAINGKLVAISMGSLKVMVPIKTRAHLLAIYPNFEKMKKYCSDNSFKGFYLFTKDTINKKNDFHARQFNPLSGVNEDPITGIAAPLLMPYSTLYDREFYTKNKSYKVEQGFILNNYGIVTVVRDMGEIFVIGNVIQNNSDLYED